VIFFAITGRRPFTADTHEELFEKIRETDID
jgi:hypothetical protein